jgi:outer membrane protein TolC
MKHFKKYTLIIILIVISNVKAHSQDSLSFYLEKAALNNPGIKARYLEYSAALEKVPQAASLPDPQLQLGYFIKPMELLGGNQVGNASLMQMFPWFGTLKAAKDEASKMAVAKFENFRDDRNELYFNVKASYYKVYRTIKEIEIAEENLGILHSLEHLALVKLSTGGKSSSSGNVVSNSSGANMSPTGTSNMGNNNMSNQGGKGTSAISSTAGSPGMGSTGGGMGGSMEGNGKNDMVNLLRIQIEMHDLENRIALLKDQLITDKVSFNRFLNRSSSSEVFTGDSLIQVSIPADLLTLTDSIGNNPMVKMYKAESEANAAKLDMVTRMGYPMIGVGLNYMLIQKRDGNTAMMNGQDMIMPMVSLTLPIYRKKQNAMRREAAFLRDAATLSAENVTNNIRVSFQQTVQNLYDADRRVKLFTDQAELAGKSVQLLIASFSASSTDFVEILRMQQQLLDYQFKQVDAVVDKNTSIAQVIYLTGN